MKGYLITPTFLEFLAIKSMCYVCNHTRNQPEVS